MPEKDDDDDDIDDIDDEDHILRKNVRSRETLNSKHDKAIFVYVII